LPEDLPLRKQVDHAIEVMPRMARPAKAPYWMNHEELKNLRFSLKNSSQKVTSNQVNHHMGCPSFLFIRRMGRWGCVWIIGPSIRQRWRIAIHCFESMISLIAYWEQRCLVGFTYVRGITKFRLWKGTKKRLLAAQGMTHTSFWWCPLGSPMHPPHFAFSWATFSKNGLMTLWSST
jgi:hypothetical protein